MSAHRQGHDRESGSDSDNSDFQLSHLDGRHFTPISSDSSTSEEAPSLPVGYGGTEEDEDDVIGKLSAPSQTAEILVNKLANRCNVAQLRRILAAYDVRGLSKLRKEQLVHETVDCYANMEENRRRQLMEALSDPSGKEGTVSSSTLDKNPVRNSSRTLRSTKGKKRKIQDVWTRIRQKTRYGRFPDDDDEEEEADEDAEKSSHKSRRQKDSDETDAEDESFCATSETTTSTSSESSAERPTTRHRDASRHGGSHPACSSSTTTTRPRITLTLPKKPPYRVQTPTRSIPSPEIGTGPSHTGTTTFRILPGPEFSPRPTHPVNNPLGPGRSAVRPYVPRTNNQIVTTGNPPPTSAPPNNSFDFWPQVLPEAPSRKRQNDHLQDPDFISMGNPNANAVGNVSVGVTLPKRSFIIPPTVVTMVGPYVSSGPEGGRGDPDNHHNNPQCRTSMYPGQYQQYPPPSFIHNGPPGSSARNGGPQSSRTAANGQNHMYATYPGFSNGEYPGPGHEDAGSDNGMPRFYKPPNSRDFRHMTTMMGSAQRERNFPDPSTPPAQNNQPQPIRRVEPFPRNDQHQQQQQIPAHHRSVINPFVPTRQNAGSSGYRPVGVNAVDLSSHAQNPRMIAPQSVIRIPLPGSAGGSIMSSNPFAAAFTNGNVERNEPVEAGIKVEKGASQSENGQISFPVIRQHYAQRREGFNGEHEYGAGRIIRPPVFHHTLAEVAPPLSIRRDPSLTSRGVYREIITTFYFDQSKINPADQNTMLLMRFCQENLSRGPSYEMHPDNLKLMLNGKTLVEPAVVDFSNRMKKKKNAVYNQPVEVSLSLVAAQNVVLVRWTEDTSQQTISPGMSVPNDDAPKDYFLVLEYAKRKTMDEILNTVSASRCSVNETVFRLYQRLAGTEADDDIVTDSQKISLHCPASRLRLTLPIRGRNCDHVDCFDASSFLYMNKAQKARWTCPKCNKPVQFDEIVVDEFIQQLVEYFPNTESIEATYENNNVVVREAPKPTKGSTETPVMEPHSRPSVVTANGGSSMVASSSSSVSNKPAPAKPPPEIITLD